LEKFCSRLSKCERLMSVSPVYSAGALGVSTPETVARAPAAAGGELPFSRLMNQFLHQVDEPQQAVAQGVNDLVAGKTENIHELAIQVAQADVAFRLVMEVRDKLISAYQEMMRMQI